MFESCSMNQICPRLRTPLMGLPRYPANAAHAGEGSSQGAAMTRDLTGERFGRWLVKGFYDKGRYGTRWLCLCDCGAIRVVRFHRLETGCSKSCGCLRNENVSKAKTIHGGTRIGGPNKEYAIWNAMIQRCTSPKCKAFPNYGGRGILPCKEWLVFSNFFNDMGRVPSVGLTLERRNNNDGYNKGNCYWASRTEQSNNQRTNKLLTLSGETHTVSEWARIKNVSPFLFYCRLRRGWSPEKVLTIPINNQELKSKETKRYEQLDLI
jgi:hypothetical protein